MCSFRTVFFLCFAYSATEKDEDADGKDCDNDSTARVSKTKIMRLLSAGTVERLVSSGLTGTSTPASRSGPSG